MRGGLSGQPMGALCGKHAFAYDFSMTPHEYFEAHEVSGLLTPSGALARPAPSNPWQVPTDMKLKGAEIVWSYSQGIRAAEADASKNIAEHFASLAQATDDEVFAFARVYGPLYLCNQHGQPSKHDTSIRLSRATGYWDGCPLRELSPGVYAERVEDWCMHARGFGAVFRLFAQLHRGHLGDPDDWRGMADMQGLQGVDVSRLSGKRPPDEEGLSEPDYLPDRRGLLAMVVGGLLRVGDVRPVLYWSGTTPVRSFAYNSVWGYLAVQLWLATGSANGLAMCASCSQVFTPTKKQSENKRTFCPSCREAGAPGRLAKQDKRTRDIRKTRRPKRN